MTSREVAEAARARQLVFTSEAGDAASKGNARRDHALRAKTKASRLCAVPIITGQTETRQLVKR